MSRKRSSFDNFMQQVEEETRAAGPQAQAEADVVRKHFRLAAQVLRRRRELGLTQKALAGRVGIHQSEISDIERGAATPGYRTLAKLADGLEAEFLLVARAPSRRQPAATKPRRAARVSRVPAYARTIAAKRSQ